AAECVCDLRSSPGAAVRHAHDDSHRLAIVTRFVGSGCANSYRLHAVVAGNGSILPDSLPLPGTARSRLPPLRPLPGFADRAGLAIADDSQRSLPEMRQRSLHKIEFHTLLPDLGFPTPYPFCLEC